MDSSTGEIIPMEKLSSIYNISAMSAASVATTDATTTTTTLPMTPPPPTSTGADYGSEVMIPPPFMNIIPVMVDQNDRVILKKCIHHNLIRYHQRSHPYHQQSLSQEGGGSSVGATTTLRLVPSTGNSKSTKINVTQTVSADGGNKIIFHSYVQSNKGEAAGGGSGNNNNNNSSSSNISTKNCNGLLAKRFLILDFYDGNSVHKCYDIKSKIEYVCKTVNNPCSNLLTAHFRLDGHPNINPLQKVIQASKQTHLLFNPSQGDLHSYVRVRKRLREAEARRLFRQMCTTVKSCHEQGIVLRDLKLRKFIFADQEKTQLRLESLEDAVVLNDPNTDLLQDKRGCPAYVSPEILKVNATYSGKAADMWSLGVILYTMLVGRYPFNDSEHATLFAKISRGHFTIPDSIAASAKCMIKSLLRRDPDERITSQDVLHHPWILKSDSNTALDIYHRPSISDQCVPDMYMSETDDQI